MLSGRRTHFRSVTPKAAVSAIIIEDDRLLLIRRAKDPNKGLWSFPGGGIELGETAAEACAREVFEETGLVVDVGSVAGVRDVIGRDGGGVSYHYVIVNFRAKVVSGELIAGSDAQEARWVSLGDLADQELTPGLIDQLDPDLSSDTS